SKVLFSSPFVEIELEAPATVPGRGDTRRLGVRVMGARVDGADVWARTQLVHGFWGPEPGEPPYQWTADRALVRVPAPRSEASLLLAADRPEAVALRCGSASVSADVDVEPRWCSVSIEAASVEVVNSAGVDLLAGGYGADRGYLEVDRGQYDEPAEVF